MPLSQSSKSGISPQPDLEKVLRSMLAHAAEHSPYYRDQRWAKTARRGVAMELKNIPITPKDVLRHETTRFYIPDVPPSEGAVESIFTSGSTGVPMEVRCTARAQRINEAENVRLAVGWGFTGHTRVAMVKNPDAAHAYGTINEDRRGGRLMQTFYTAESGEAFRFVSKAGATLLYAYPQIALGILEYGIDIGVKLPLKLISTVSEVTPDRLRVLVRDIPGCRLVDRYGSVEAGIMAMQCATCGAYHLADRHAVIEILDDSDRPVKAGKMGRVIVTRLFNLAMPLVRYETGDYAVVAKAKECPHSPVALTQIAGRDRTLFKLPDGRRISPRIDPRVLLDLRIRQFKLIQRTKTDIDFLYVTLDATMEMPQERAQELVDRDMAPGFKVACVKVAELKPSASGKYLMHECWI